MNKLILSTLVLLSFFATHHSALAQNIATGGVYKSEVDELLTIQSVSVLPFLDNVQGIYARPLENYFIEYIGQMHRWDMVPMQTAGPIMSPEELEDDLNATKQLAAGIKADAFFATRISKGPNGITIIMDLFLTKDGKLLTKSSVKDSKRFDLNDLKEQLVELLNKILVQIPYQGRVLSRDGQRVTVNIGKKDGIQANQVVSVVQIITANRHPKFNFIINTEKEIIGRIKILKVDDSLSFGQIIAEKEKGTVQKNAKIAGLDFVTYPAKDTLDDPNGTADLNQRPDSPVSFGDNPQAWTPKKLPGFGQVGARLGNAFYTGSMQLDGPGGIEASTKIAPSIFLDGELWLTPKYSVHAGFKQGIIPITNPRPGSTPSDLNQSLTAYELLFGYNFRFSPSIWGPSLELLLGYMTYKMYVDDSSPRGLTTMEYNGFKAGGRGQFPVGNDERWMGGVELFMIFMPKLNESPVTSGASSDSNINMFGIFATRKLSENMKLLFKLDFEQYTTNFSGNGTRTETATSASQRLTTFSGGLYYLF